MAEVIVGGETLSVSLGTYRRFKAALAFLARTQELEQDYTAALDTIIAVIAVGLDDPLPGEPALSVPSVDNADVIATAGADHDRATIAYRINYINDHLKPSELHGLKPLIVELLADTVAAQMVGGDTPKLVFTT